MAQIIHDMELKDAVFGNFPNKKEDGSLGNRKIDIIGCRFITVMSFVFVTLILLFFYETNASERIQESKGYFRFIVTILAINFISMATIWILGPGEVAGSSEDYEQVGIDLRHCEVCNIEQPLRTKHCRICQRCIPTYDHHCGFMGVCVGERNRFPFMIFSVASFIFFFHSFFGLWSGFAESSGVLDFILKNAILLAAILVSFFALFLTSMLAFSHVYNISSNTTMWEFDRPERITYLKDQPLGYRPFSLGLIRNWKISAEAMFHKRGRRWVFTPYDPEVEKERRRKLESQWWYKYWENENYSCC